MTGMLSVGAAASSISVQAAAMRKASGPSTAGASGMQSAGNALAIAGAAVSSISAFFAADSARYAGRSRALNLEFEASMAGVNAELAERAAATAIRAGRGRHAQVTEEFGRLKSSARASQAASGLQAGVGSSAEVMASIEFAKARESSTISMNAVRAANAARMRAVDLRNRQLLNRVSAHNVRTQANNISPWLASATSLIGSSGNVISSFASQGGRG